MHSDALCVCHTSTENPNETIMIVLCFVGLVCIAIKYVFRNLDDTKGANEKRTVTSLYSRDHFITFHFFSRES